MRQWVRSQTGRGSGHIEHQSKGPVRIGVRAQGRTVSISSDDKIHEPVSQSQVIVMQRVRPYGQSQAMVRTRVGPTEDESQAQVRMRVRP